MAPQVISALLAFLLLSEAAQAHDIYTHLKSRSGRVAAIIQIAAQHPIGSPRRAWKC